ncbi:hypothetical protein PFISCL1PPCAC_7976, partial [Pristionchus fissidentatus]
QRILDTLEVLEVYGSAYAQLSIAIERVVSILDINYEKRFAERWQKAIILIIAASKLYLPILLNELACEIIKITSYQCLFFGVFLFYQHARIMTKSSEMSIFSSTQMTENYFSNYTSAWK